MKDATIARAIAAAAETGENQVIRLAAKTDLRACHEKINAAAYEAGLDVRKIRDCGIESGCRVFVMELYAPEPFDEATERQKFIGQWGVAPEAFLVTHPSQCGISDPVKIAAYYTARLLTPKAREP